MTLPLFLASILWFSSCASPRCKCELKSHVLSPNVDGSYVVSNSGLITRNGVAQTINIDYTINSATLIPKLKWNTTDLVTIWTVESQ